MERSFQFVDVTRLDRAARRSLKSHAMRGKNAGRKFHRRSKIQPSKQPLFSNKDLRSTGRASYEEEHIQCLTRNPGNIFLTLSWPVELTSRSGEVIHQFFIRVADGMYPDQLAYSSDDHISLWFQMMLADDAATHCSIALMEASNNFFLGRSANSPESLHHLSRTFVLVQDRLNSQNFLSDYTLVTILMLVTQDQMRNARMEASIHYQGLRRMIELRGGLYELENNLPLMHKICKMDITYSLQFGGPLHFFRDRFHEARLKLTTEGFNLKQISVSQASRYANLNSNLREVLLDVASIAHLFDNTPTDRKIDVGIFQELVISVCSRLIRLCPLGDSCELTAAEGAYHIGLIAFMMTLFLQYGYHRAVKYGLVSLRLKEVLELYMDKLDYDLCLWLTLIGRIWTWETHDEFWNVKIRILLDRLSIASWADVLCHVTKFPWINSLHGQLGQRAWEIMHESSDVL